MELKELIEFNFDPAFYVGEARRALDDNVVKQNIDKLKKASAKLIEQMGDVPDVDFSKVLAFLQKEYNAGTAVNDVNISADEIRALSYHLSSLWEYPFLKWSVELLECNWSTSNLRGLVHSLLAHWQEGEPDGDNLIMRTTVYHIEHDKSRTTEVLKIIKNEIQNPYKLGLSLRKRNVDINSVCGIFGLPVNRFNYAYFSGVICAYYEKVDIDEMEDMFEVLKRHNNVRADKTVIPNWIVSLGARSIPQELYDFAMKRIGDPFAKEKWAPFPLATREEATKLESARKILSSVISSKIINIFFKELCEDVHRKNFWLKYTDKVSDFSVYGTEATRSIIRAKLDRYVISSHFRLVATNTTNCALVMEMSDYTIIEFTDTGAMYAYKNDSANYERVFKRSIERLEDLKLPYLNMLMNLAGEFVTRYNDEGRMVHMGHWQRRLSKWIDRKIR